MGMLLADTSTLTRIFCRFQQTSLMLMLRSNVTQQRLKNLRQNKVSADRCVVLSIIQRPTWWKSVKWQFFLTNLRSGWGSDKHTRRKPGYRLQSWERKTDVTTEDKDSKNCLFLRVINTADQVQRTAMISALEMVGAMLLMNREQVLWRGRGLGESSLGFFSSFFSSLAFSFGFSSSIFGEWRPQRQELWILGKVTLKYRWHQCEFPPSPSSSSSSLSSVSSFFAGLSEQLEFESESESESLSEALASSSLSPLRFLFLLGWYKAD